MPPDVNFKAKMHKIQFRWGSALDLAGGAYGAPPNLLEVKGPASKRRTGKERRKRKEKGR